MRCLATAVGLALTVVSQAAAQPAEAPRFAVGDTWTRSNGVTLTVVAVDGAAATIRGFFSAHPTALVAVDGNLQPVAITDWEGRPLDPAETRGLPLGKEWRLFDWPLEAGKTWPASGQLVARNGAKVSITIARRVAGVEQIQTPSGTFTAYRIEESWTVPYYPSGGWVNTIWYAPAAKTIVKFQSSDANQKAWEVVSYRVK